MAKLAAVSSATPSLASLVLRSRAEQARRDADRADGEAQSLRQQAEAQDRIGRQAREQAQALDSRSRRESPLALGSAGFATTPLLTPTRSSEPTYLGTLSAVVAAAQPLLALDLSTTQKNIVKSSLFATAATVSSRLLDARV